MKRAKIHLLIHYLFRVTASSEAASEIQTAFHSFSLRLLCQMAERKREEVVPVVKDEDEEEDQDLQRKRWTKVRGKNGQRDSETVRDNAMEKKSKEKEK